MSVKKSKLTEEEILRRYPIKGKTPDWFFRINEISNGLYEVEGTDKYGRLVSRQGTNPDEIFIECELDAKRINETSKRT